VPTGHEVFARSSTHFSVRPIKYAPSAVAISSVRIAPFCRTTADIALRDVDGVLADTEDPAQRCAYLVHPLTAAPHVQLSVVFFQRTMMPCGSIGTCDWRSWRIVSVNTWGAEANMASSSGCSTPPRDITLVPRSGCTS
jgi:hypothetical protein